MDTATQLTLFSAPATQVIEQSPDNFTDRLDASLWEVNRHRLFEALDYLSNVPLLNSGGCGISALALYRYCKSNGIPVDDRPFLFIWSSGDEWEAANNDKLLKKGEIDRIEAPGHVVIRLPGGDYDSDGLNSPLYKRCRVQQKFLLNEEELLNVINRVDEWNPTFRRAKWVNQIEENLGIDLSDVAL